MRFESQITRVPRPYDAGAAEEAAALYPEFGANLRALIGGTAGCSPYLASLIKRESRWLQIALDDPDAACTRTLEFVADDPADAKRRLRSAKRRIALITALADLGGVWPLERVTGLLTQLADIACETAFEEALRPLIRRGKLPGLDEDTPLSASGLVVFAMGKMGAHELNYSSDIDLIVMFDPARFDKADFLTIRQGFVRAARQAVATLSDMTADGYVFRTDLRLRPDPSVTPIVVSMDAAERYYETLGRTWERAAWIKARPCAGDVARGQRFQESLTPFVWRKHLDFAAIEDAHHIRLAIRDHKGDHGALKLEGHDLKLGRGGIREIEFFTQTRQLIAGGRMPHLRARGTKQALTRLAETKWIPAERAESLAARYTFLRTAEHRVQMMRDAQTHSLPKTPADFERLAALMDYDVPTLRAELYDHLTHVDRETEAFFVPPHRVERSAEPLISDTYLTRWRSYPALRSARSVTLFDRILPRIETCLARASKPDEALAAFDTFLSRLPAGVQLFSLFEANPDLIDLLVDIVGTVPALARYLAQNASVFDAVIAGTFFDPWPGASGLQALAYEEIMRARDYEDRLDAARRWNKDWHFRIGVHFLRGLITAKDAARQYGDLAHATLCALWPAIEAQFAARHGPQPGAGAALLGMGSFGIGRLTPQSDLDLIVVYDAGDVETSEGPRPLPTRTYYARLTQAMITALTAATAAGRLYEVDMRLRPSGNQGPVATSWAAFQDYQTNRAWLWEHLALTRARVLQGPKALSDALERFRCELIAAPRDPRDVLTAVSEMRGRIFATQTTDAPWIVKVGPGRMQDIELLAQAGLLLSGTPQRQTADGITALGTVGLLTEAQVDQMIEIHALQTRVQIALRLLDVEGQDVANLGEGGQALLTRIAGFEAMDAAETALAEAQKICADLIDRVLAE